MSKAKKPPFADIRDELRGIDDPDERRDVVTQAARERSLEVAALIWQMVRVGAIDVWQEHGLWSDLEEEPEQPTTADVLALLRAAPVSVVDVAQINQGGLIRWWPQEVDRVVVAAYRRDPGAFDEAAPSLPDLARDGLVTVQRRAGAVERSAVPQAVVVELAAAVAAPRGGWLWYSAKGGEPERVGIRNAAFLEMVYLFAAPRVWGKTLLEAAGAGGQHAGDVRVFAEALAAASSGQLAHLLQGFRATEAVPLTRVLLDERPESAAWFHAQADEQRGAPKDVCAVTAILRCKREGEPVPTGWEDDLTFEAITYGAGGEFTGYELHVEALRYLGEERAVDRLMRANSSLVRWRTLAVLSAAPAVSLIGRIVAEVSVSPLSELDTIQRAAARALGNLGAKVVGIVTSARRGARTSASREFFDIALAVASGAAMTSVPLASGPSPASGTTSEAIASAAARLPRGGTPVRIFLLERDEGAVSVEGTSRIGGPPLGIADDAWPRRGRRVDARMEHLITLVSQDLPGASLPDGVDAVALFITNRIHNRASTPDNDEIAVVLLAADDLARGESSGAPPPRALDRCGLRITPLDVAAEVFEREPTEPDVIALRDALLGSPGFALGEPIWLQDEAFDGTFVCQLDSSLVPMNLGDRGVLYVFTDRAFWQSA